MFFDFEKREQSHYSETKLTVNSFSRVPVKKNKMNFSGFVTPAIVAIVSWLLPKLNFLRNPAILEVLKQSAQFPKSDKYKELHLN